MKRKIGTYLQNIDIIIMGFLLVNIFFWMTVNVFCRFVLNFSLTFSDEFCRICFVWMTLIALEYNVRRNNNVSMTIVFKKIPRKIQMVITIITDIVTGIMLAVLLPDMIELTKMHKTVRTAALGMPRVYITGVGLITVILTIIMLIRNCFETVKIYKTGGELC